MERGSETPSPENSNFFNLFNQNYQKYPLDPTLSPPPENISVPRSDIRPSLQVII